MGMRVVELDINWINSPFWRREFTIKNDKEIQLLKEYCSTIVVDLKASSKTSLAHLLKKSKTDATLTPDNEDNAHAVSRGDIVDKPLKKQKIDKKPLSAIERKIGFLAAPELLNRKEIQQIESHIALCVKEIKEVFTRISNGDTVSCVALSNAVERLTHDALNNAGSLLFLSQMKEKEQSLAEKSVNVSILTIAFAQYLQLDSRHIHVLGLGALLHDVGMLKVPDYLLTHPGPLNKAQKQAIEYHVTEGLSFVGLHDELSGVRELRDIIGNHHERYDGSGYPKGLKGDKIPYLSRILGITTTYEAMTRERFYSEASSPTQALARMYNWRSKLFDAELVQHFIKALGVYPPGSMVELEDNKVAVVTAINPENRTRPVIRILNKNNKNMAENSEDLDLMMPELAHIRITRTLEESDLAQLNAG